MRVTEETFCGCDADASNSLRPKKLHGIIHIHHLSDLRMGGILEKNFHKFQQLCSEETLRNVIIVTHSPGSDDSSIDEACQTLLCTSDMFFKSALALNARMSRHDGSRESAMDILDLILKDDPSVNGLEDGPFSCCNCCIIM